MKKLFSKKSGFTLVEIVIAFAIFAIMAAMLMQVLRLTINRRMDNKKFEDNLQDQEEILIAKGKTLKYDETEAKDGTLSLKFKDKDGKNIPMNLDYQLRSADGTLGEKAGINYFVGQLTYDDKNGEVTYIPGSGSSSGGSGSGEGGGSSQMSRFDTRITGTKGIISVKVSYTYNSGTDEYTFKVIVDDSLVDTTRKSSSQVTLFLGEDKANGEMASIKEVNGGSKSQADLKLVKQSGPFGINLHCPDGGFNGVPREFKVKLNKPLTTIGFANGTYYQFTDSKGNNYVNIFGAYEKTAEPAS